MFWLIYIAVNIKNVLLWLKGRQRLDMSAPLVNSIHNTIMPYYTPAQASIRCCLNSLTLSSRCLLNYTYEFAVNWSEITADQWPQIWSYECSFASKKADSLVCSVCLGSDLLKVKLVWDMAYWRQQLLWRFDTRLHSSWLLGQRMGLWPAVLAECMHSPIRAIFEH